VGIKRTEEYTVTIEREEKDVGVVWTNITLRNTQKDLGEHIHTSLDLSDPDVMCRYLVSAFRAVKFQELYTSTSKTWEEAAAKMASDEEKGVYWRDPMQNRRL